MEDIIKASLTLAPILGLIVAYLKIKSHIQKEQNERDLKIKEYVDKEIYHLKEKSFGEIKQLEKKIDELRSDIQRHQNQIIDILTKKEK